MKLPCLFDNYHVIVFKIHVSRMTKGIHVISIACQWWLNCTTVIPISEVLN